MSSLITRHVETIYCDDIRSEVGGKLSFMGVYTHSLGVSDFPIELPKFCIFVRTVWPSNENEHIESIRIEVLKDEEVLREINVEPKILKQAQSKPAHPKSELGVYSNNSGFVFSPLKFEEESVIRVKVFLNGVEMRGNGLVVARNTNQVQAS